MASDNNIFPLGSQSARTVPNIIFHLDLAVKNLEAYLKGFTIWDITARFTPREVTSGVMVTSYWCKSLSGSSTKKWLALTMQRCPETPFPGRRGNLSDLLEAGAACCPKHGAGSGPVYAPTPELHQATQASKQPWVTMQPVRAESSAGSSSNPPVHEAMAQLKPPSAEETAVLAAPASSKSLRFPLRPGKGV
ncbi:Argonaute/Dicer protein, PAZ [Artemisia annua]|uniref:Argonaute/Dicer protein, PAZ n=1 Tax=Artemisia annua TaxID=35608 RepID=A0A2U1NFF5_ARTAN|nr:Argonaute/Dicer protein, PAZ [Artemisia annua]